MSILDFKEIPSASRIPDEKALAPGSEVAKDDLDAFEKFAEEFFEKVMGYKIDKRIARGSDLGADLIAFDGTKRVLVSCKHYAFSDKAVGLEDSDCVIKMGIHDCDRFVGFYSTGPTTSLRDAIQGLSVNKIYAHYEFEIMKSSDIESRLLDKDEASGWLLAARYFPKSFANLFRRFVVPIAHYKEKDVIEKSPNTLVLKGPFGGTVSGPITKKKFVDRANDELTNAVHRVFFREALKEAIDVFPSYFQLAARANPDSVKMEEISPTWEVDFSQRAISPGTDCNTAIMVCALWSFWDKRKAVLCYVAARKKGLNIFDKEQEHFANLDLSTHLSIGYVLQLCNSFYRDIFARLAAFCPLSLPISDSTDWNSFAQSTGEGMEWKFEPTEGYDFLMNRL